MGSTEADISVRILIIDREITVKRGGKRRREKWNRLKQTQDRLELRSVHKLKRFYDRIFDIFAFHVKTHSAIEILSTISSRRANRGLLFIPADRRVVQAHRGRQMEKQWRRIRWREQLNHRRIRYHKNDIDQHVVVHAH